jgi:hypothetical protein
MTVREHPFGNALDPRSESADCVNRSHSPAAHSVLGRALCASPRLGASVSQAA